jgi:hypothetical protein
MGTTPPKFGGGGKGCEVWRTKCSEGDIGTRGGSTIEAFPVESETRPLDHKYLQKASTSSQMDNFTVI